MEPVRFVRSVGCGRGGGNYSCTEHNDISSWWLLVLTAPLLPPPYFFVLTLLPYSSSFSTHSTSHLHLPQLTSPHTFTSQLTPFITFYPSGFRELKIKCIQPKALQNFFSGKSCTKESPHLFVLSLRKVCAWMYVDIITSTQHCSCIYMHYIQLHCYLHVVHMHVYIHVNVSYNCAFSTEFNSNYTL